MGMHFLDKPWVGFGILLSLSSLVGLLMWGQFGQASQAHQMVAHTYQVLSRINALHAAINEAESVQRGFVLSGRPEFLDMYENLVDEQAQGTVHKELKMIGALVHDNPKQKARLSFLHKSLKKKIDYMNEVIEKRKKQDLLAAKVIITRGRGMALMNEIHGHIEALRLEEERLLAERVKAYEQRKIEIFALSLTLIILLVTTMGTSIFSAQRELNRRRTAEKILRELSSFQKAILDGSQSGIIVVDNEGTVILFNPAAERMLGYTAEEVIGKCTPLLFHDTKEVEKRGRELSDFLNKPISGIETLCQIPRLQNSEEREWTYIAKNGRHFPVQLCVSSLHDGAGNVTGFMGLATDITERRQIEKMKNEFISTVSHELRTPLTSIRGSLGLVAGNVTGDLPEKAQNLIAIAYKNSERLVRLINNILDIEKIESGHIVFERKPVQIGALINQATQEAQGVVDEYGIKLNVDCQCEHAVVTGDFDRLLQVIANLISNAAKFSPSNGVITLQAKRNDDGHIEIGVHDEGEGVPEAFRSRIFGKFAQADTALTQQKGGSGLGLSISRAIAESMGGSLDFKSEPGNTYFFMRLPETSEEDAAEMIMAESNRPRILICEENKDTSAFLEMILAQEGYVCVIASSLQEARQRLLEEHFAAMTLDVGLSDDGGFDLIRELRAKESTMKLPVIIISTQKDNGDPVTTVAAAGIVDWLTKPIDVERLRRALQSLSSMPHHAAILHIEDDADITSFLASAMENIEIVPAHTLSAARGQIASRPFDLAVLDIYMPDGNGLDLLPELAAKSIPVVILSVNETSKDIQRRVCASLVKTVVSETKVVDTIKAFIRRQA